MTTFRFTAAEIDTIAAALAEAPYKTAAPILDSIVEQIQAEQRKRRKKT